MYAHEVMADLMRLADIFDDSEEPKANSFAAKLRGYSSLIQASFKFHSDVESVWEPFEEQSKQNPIPLFMDSELPVRLPYPLCWFDFMSSAPTTKDAKIGMLAYNDKFHDQELEKNDLFNVVLFTFVTDPVDDELMHLMAGKRGRFWMPSLQVACVSVGKLFLDREDFRDQFIGHEDDGRGNIQYHSMLNETWLKEVDIVKSKDEIDRQTQCLSLLQCFLNLLNCTNIRYVPREPSKKLNKSRQRKNKLPILSHHTLEINLSRNQERGEWQRLPSGRRCGIHARMGKYRAYLRKALFGKWFGVFWWNPRVIGGNKDRIVTKDYKVKSSKGK